MNTEIILKDKTSYNILMSKHHIEDTLKRQKIIKTEHTKHH